MGDISIKVDCLAGRDCKDLIRQMCVLASHLGVDVQSNLNGVEVRAQPFCDVEALCKAWDESLTSTRPHKFVMGKVTT